MAGPAKPPRGDEAELFELYHRQPNALREADPGSAVLIYGTLPPVQLKLSPWYKDRRLRRLARTSTKDTAVVRRPM
jgi:hypothetical protein